MDVEAAKARCVKKWIREQYPALATVTEMLVEEYYKAEALEDFDIGLMKHHTLTSWELDQSKCNAANITTGTKLNFANGVDTKYGINCTDTNYLSGEYEVTQFPAIRRAMEILLIDITSLVLIKGTITVLMC